MEPSVLAGQVACLTAAFCWAFSVGLFRRPVADYGARAVNLGKSCIATVLLGLTSLALGQWPELLRVPVPALLLVVASGVVGMSFGDTALFAAVQRLGVHRTLLLQTLAPVFTAILAYAFYGERLGPRQGLGALVILVGVVVVIDPRWRRRPVGSSAAPDAELAVAEVPEVTSAAVPAAFSGAGVVLAVLAALGQGSGVVLAKAGMEEMPVLLASFVRLTAAAAGLVIVLTLSRRLRSASKVLAPAGLRRLVGPAFLGTYVAILLMMLGIAWAPASLAAVLLATTPVFGLFVDSWMEGTPITLRGLVGTAVAVAGVAILSLPG
ncbi:MAG: DMT family transporter [Acidobacteriota bacterium]|nr:DMT family transporter [Acidobacteriota bacterium]